MGWRRIGVGIVIGAGAGAGAGTGTGIGVGIHGTLPGTWSIGAQRSLDVAPKYRGAAQREGWWEHVDILRVMAIRGPK